jgi:hypothetical protein
VVAGEPKRQRASFTSVQSIYDNAGKYGHIPTNLVDNVAAMRIEWLETGFEGRTMP